MSNLVEGKLLWRDRMAFDIEIGDADSHSRMWRSMMRRSPSSGLRTAGKYPVEDYVVRRHLPSGELETLCHRDVRTDARCCAGSRSVSPCDENH